MKTSLAAVATALLTTTPVHAADTAEADTIIVVGQTDTPVTVVPRGLAISLNQENFDAINAINVEDLMKYTPNFFVRKRFAGDDNAVVAMRGANTVQSARTIVLVDGFVVSNFLGNRFDFPPKWNVVGPAEVRQFDIVYGPYSARYNGHAMGGVISVTTQTPREGWSATGTVQTMLMPFEEYGFDQTFRGYSVEGALGYRQKDGPWSVRASFRHFENTGQSMTYNLFQRGTGAATATVTGAFVDPRLIRPAGLAANAETAVFGAASPVEVGQDQARLRIGYETAGGWEISALGVLWQTRQDLTNPRSWLVNSATGAPVYQGNVSFNGVTYNASGLTLSTTRRTEYLAGVKLAGPLAGWDVALNLSRFWIDRQEVRASNDYLTGAASGAGRVTIGNNPGWYTGALSIERRLGGHKLAFGADANHYATSTDTYRVTNWRTAAGAAYANSSYGKTSFWGLWAEDAIDLGAEVVLTAGLRYDRWRAFSGGLGTAVAGNRTDARFADRTDAAVSPKLSLQGALPGGLEAQLSLGLATRFPTVGELFQGSQDTAGNLIATSFNPFLRPERSRDASLLLRRAFGPLRATASLFFQDVKDAVFSFQGTLPDNTLFNGFQNVDLVRQYGAELIVEGHDVLVKGLDVDANLAWMSAKTRRNTADPRAVGVQFPRIPAWRANGNLRYRLAEPLRASLGWRYGSRPNSDLLGLQRGRAFGFQSEYLLFDTRLSWAFTRRFELSAGIDNLFNYRAYVAHPLPQRTLVVDLKARL
ncbi:TonB-dependent receptor [Novosphingobium sp.]|uniref:TonB-dependent receptor n=1 Tax=Novosphingobium sp. TaxID=1874826 RepID=UPI00262A4D08|nr:TonB-dependent receptor [Novosphingobium sp.]